MFRAIPHWGTLAGKRSAVVLANRGPAVAAKDFEAAVYAAEELGETAKLALHLRGAGAIALTPGQINEVVTKFDVEWD